MSIQRRNFLAATGATWLWTNRLRGGDALLSPLITRGVVLLPEDLSLADWPERAHRAGLTTIGIHHPNSPRAVVAWIKTDAGQKFLDACARQGLNIEYELHALRELLPRNRFAKNPELFRQDDKGNRNPDANCCVHSKLALDLIAESAADISRVLRPTTGRYFFWGDDGQSWCNCSRCKALIPSEQALLIENRILDALHALDRRATIAHLAYANTLAPPRQVKPEQGVFLEFAPIRRRHDMAYEKQTGADALDPLAALDANLESFPTASAQVLEYWLDVSRFSGWKRPATKLPWRFDVVKADLATYRSRGIRHVTSFAAYIDEDYRRMYGDPSFVSEYGALLSGDQLPR